MRGWLASGPARSGMAHGAAGRGAGGTGSPARILGGGRGRFCQRARLVRETGRDAGDAGRAVSAGRARGSGSGSCGSRPARAGPEVWAVRGERERVGRGPSWEKKGPRVGLDCWVGFGFGLGWVFFYFSFFSPLTQTKLKRNEFKFKFEFNPITQTNKTMHQHECNKHF